MNNQKINFNNLTVQTSLYNFFNQLYSANDYYDYIIEMMWEGDKAIQNGMKSGSSYTSAMFIS